MEATLGGYMAQHGRAAAFGGSDGQAYSVGLYVDDEPDARGRFGAALLFVRWDAAGAAPAGHVETELPRLGPHPRRSRGAAQGAVALRREGGARRGHRALAGGVVTGIPGTVLERDGAAYRVETEPGELRAVLHAAARSATRPASWWATGSPCSRTPPAASPPSPTWPRGRSLLERRVPLGRGTRPIAANIDTVFVVTSNCDPAPVPQLIDRLLVVAESNEIAAAVVINKMDLDPGTWLEPRFRQAGYPVFRTSAKTGEGLEALRAAMAGRESVVTGPSGAGKSSLLNALQPGLGLRTGELSLRVRRGRNTTVSARMLPFEGGYLVDTPGFNEVGLWGIEPRELASCFPEFRPFLGECRFQDCRHLTEPGCRVQAAVADGTIAPDRLESYRMLLEETEAEPEEWE